MRLKERVLVATLYHDLSQGSSNMGVPLSPFRARHLEPALNVDKWATCKNMPQFGATALPLLSVWGKGHWKSPRAKKDASPPKLLSLLDLKHQTPKIGGFVAIDNCY